MKWKWPSNDVAALKRQSVEGKHSGKSFYFVMYRQDMGILKFKSRFGVGKFSHRKIRRGRSTEDINRIMLAMMMNAASRFEGQQSLRSFSWYTDSGLSGEDLVKTRSGKRVHLSSVLQCRHG
ncbi:hypothetical protein ACCW92_16970 [Enterobacter soli]|uniref:hypothetical protein n=1 Tax=Enterobacter soli TaxID=885040 RepID=UPI003ED9D4F4